MASEWTKKKFTHQFVLYALVFTTVLIIYTLRNFIDAFLGAVILYIIFRPLMQKWIRKNKFRKGWLAMGIILISFTLILIPFVVISYMIIPKLSLFFSDGSITMNLLNQADQKILELTGIKLMSPENISKLQLEATTYITNFLSESMLILTNILLLFFIFYYMLVNTGKNEAFMNVYLPFTQDKIKRFSDELESQTFSNALGSPLLAIVQAISAVFGYWIFGLPEPVFWGVMTGFFSFVPVLGSTLIWLPASIFELSTGHTWQGIGIAIYGIVIIGTVDNLFRMVFQKKFADVHPLVTIVGVITGLQLFGVTGIIFGPLLLSYFLILLKIFREEYLTT